MQAENQQRLKDREQELKDMKKMMDVMKVGLCFLYQFSQNENHISHKPCNNNTVISDRCVCILVY